MEAEAIDRKIIKDLLDNGYNMSPQRKLLISRICELGEITAIEDLWISLRLVHPIAWATVYANVKLLLKTGWLIKENHTPPSTYRLNIN